MCSERKPPIIQNHNGASSSMKEEANVVLERTYEKESGAKKSKGGKPKKISIKEKAKKKAAIKLYRYNNSRGFRNNSCGGRNFGFI